MSMISNKILFALTIIGTFIACSRETEQQKLERKQADLDEFNNYINIALVEEPKILKLREKQYYQCKYELKGLDSLGNFYKDGTTEIDQVGKDYVLTNSRLENIKRDAHFHYFNKLYLEKMDSIRKVNPAFFREKLDSLRDLSPYNFWSKKNKTENFDNQ